MKEKKMKEENSRAAGSKKKIYIENIIKNAVTFLVSIGIICIDKKLIYSAIGTDNGAGIKICFSNFYYVCIFRAAHSYRMVVIATLIKMPSPTTDITRFFFEEFSLHFIFPPHRRISPCTSSPSLF